MSNILSRDVKVKVEGNNKSVSFVDLCIMPVTTHSCSFKFPF